MHWKKLQKKLEQLLIFAILSVFMIYKKLFEINSSFGEQIVKKQNFKSKLFNV